MRMMSMMIRGDKPIVAAVHDGIGLLILLGDEVESFRNRRIGVTLLVEVRPEGLWLKDALGLAPVLIVDREAEADLRAAKAVHLVVATETGVTPVAQNVTMRWPAHPKP